MDSKLFLGIGWFLQLVVFICFLLFGDYKEFVEPEFAKFEFTHLMIFAGFGFLYTFIRRYSWSGVGQNLFTGVLAIEFFFIFYWMWLYLLDSRYTASNYTIKFSYVSMLQAEFCAGAVLVSYGALIGKVDSLQMMLLALYESFFYSLNQYIVTQQIEAIDSGGGIVLHMFGGYFGVAATWAFAQETNKDHVLNITSYTSNIFALIGTLLLWVSWPSFNAALSFNHPSRSIFNTFLALLGSTVAAYFLSAFLNKGKFSMVSIVNATLAGGVAMGTACERLKYPAFALLLGHAAGTLSTFGFERLSKIIEVKFNILDNAGIHNLHAMPGLLGAIASIFIMIDEEHDHQSEKQVYGILCTLGMAITTGIIFGKLLRLQTKSTKFYADGEHWVECDFGNNTEQEKAFFRQNTELRSDLR